MAHERPASFNKHEAIYFIYHCQLNALNHMVFVIAQLIYLNLPLNDVMRHYVQRFGGVARDNDMDLSI